MDPRHRLLAVAKGSPKEKARRERHKWEQPIPSSENYRVPGDHAPDAEFFKWLCGILPGDGQLGQKIGSRGRGLISNACPSQAIADRKSTRLNSSHEWI